VEGFSQGDKRSEGAGLKLIDEQEKLAAVCFLRACKRSQASTLLNNLRLVNAAKDQYAIEYGIQNHSPSGSQVDLCLEQASGLSNALDRVISGTSANQKMDSITNNLDNFHTLPSMSGAKSGFSDVSEDIFRSPYSANQTSQSIMSETARVLRHPVSFLKNNGKSRG